MLKPDRVAVMSMLRGGPFWRTRLLLLLLAGVAGGWLAPGLCWRNSGLANGVDWTRLPTTFLSTNLSMPLEIIPTKSNV